MKKFALVDLKGGLGNQIFIVCFAHYLKSNNYYVALDASFFKYNQQFPRELEIDLNKTNLKTLTFRNFTTHDGLPGNFILAIEEDDSGSLWIGTNNGLSRFNGKRF